jgi:single-strand DNA-binding protein
MSYEHTVIVGNLGNDPEMRYTPNGKAVVNFSVAVSRKYAGKDGQAHEKTKWFRVTAWDKLAETCNQYLRKGRQVLVAGEVKASAYANQAGEPAASLELTAREVRFLGGKGGAAAAGGPAAKEDLPF